jgi:hypothetical protein
MGEATLRKKRSYDVKCDVSALYSDQGRQEVQGLKPRLTAASLSLNLISLTAETLDIRPQLDR